MKAFVLEAISPSVQDLIAASVFVDIETFSCSSFMDPGVARAACLTEFVLPGVCYTFF